MRTSRGIVAAACLLQLACSSEGIRRVRVGIPGYTPLRPAEIGEIYLADFRTEEAPPDFDAGKEIGDYLYTELARKFEGKVSRRPVPADKAGRAGEKDFWRSLPAGPGPAVFLTGTVLYREEVRKALLETDPKVIDGPFRQERTELSQRRVYTLRVGVSLIRAGTGEVVLSKEFNETTTFFIENVPVSYAFFELAPQVRQRFFQDFFGDERLQERYLFTK